MVKTMISERGLNFNDLEKEIFRIGCKFATNLMEQILSDMDEHIKTTRDKKKYRHKGKRWTTLKTLMGDVSYGRTVYETDLESGGKACIFLLDDTLNLNTIGKVTSNLAARIAECASVCSYRETAEKVSGMTGQAISHGGAWNVVQSLGEKLSEVEKEQADRAKADRGSGEIITPILFEEADGVWINMQGKDRPKRGRKCEMKMAVAYDGWVKEDKGRYRLSNKVMVCGFEDTKAFMEKKEGAIAAVFNTDEVTIRVLNGDGGNWIKAELTDADVHFQLDPFHKNREITRKVKDKAQREAIQSLLSEGHVDLCLAYIKGVAELAKEEVEKNDLLGLYEYFKSNEEGLLPYKERGLKLPEPPEGLEYRNLGTMEHHVCDGAAKRMKHQKASWSKKGASNLGRILCLKVCENLYEAVTSLSKATLPERYAEDIEEVLSAAKAPKEDGNGYLYPVRGGRPFANTFMTNGRKAILSLIENRDFNGLSYR